MNARAWAESVVVLNVLALIGAVACVGLQIWVALVWDAEEAARIPFGSLVFSPSSTCCSLVAREEILDRSLLHAKEQLFSFVAFVGLVACSLSQMNLSCESWHQLLSRGNKKMEVGDDDIVANANLTKSCCSHIYAVHNFDVLFMSVVKWWKVSALPS